MNKLDQQAEKVKEELFKLINLSYDVIPDKEVFPLIQSVRAIEKYRSLANKKMQKQQFNLFFDGWLANLVKRGDANAR